MADYKANTRLAVEKITGGFRQIFNIFETLRQSLSDDFQNMIGRAQDTIEAAQKQLKAFDPDRNLKLGYSIITDKNKKIIKSASQLKIGDDVNTKLHKGSFISKVSKLNKAKAN